MSIFEIEGISYTGWKGSSKTLGSKDTLDMMQKVGANAIAVAGTSASIAYRAASTVVNNQTTFAEIEQVLYDAEARGLKTLLKPHLFIEDGSSTTSLAPDNVATFFATYKAMLLDYARIAEKYHVGALSIGNEMDSLVGPSSLPYWTDIIQSVRRVYSGQLTYASTWTHPAEPAFLRQLDFIGVNPYLPVSNSTNPTYQQIVDTWNKAPAASSWQARAWNGASFVDHLHNLSETLGKPVVLTEVGYQSGSRAAIEPGDAANPGSPNQELQALLYRAFFDVWSTQSDWMKGCYFWAWSPLTDPSQQEKGWGTNYDIRGKLAESVVRDAFGGPTAIPSKDGPTSTITVKTAGDSWNGHPELVIAVDGLIVGRAQVTANPWLGQWQDVTFAGRFAQNGPEKVEVFFANDAYGGPNMDRNLYIASITVNGRNIAASEGENAGGPTDNSGATLSSNGAITFYLRDGTVGGSNPAPPTLLPQQPAPTVPGTTIGTGSDTLVLKVSQDAYKGDAQYAVKVDGVQIGGPITAKALRASGQSEALTIKGDWAPGSHTVSVSILNDLWDGTPTTDRNIHVESATYNGAAVAGSNLGSVVGTEQFVVADATAKPVPTPALTPTPLPQQPAPTVPGTTIGTGSDTLVLKVSQDSYKGDAQYAVKVDGVQISGSITAKALHASGQSEALTIKGDWAPGSHTVSVSILNDLWDGTPTTDRNIYVESATHNGAAVAGSNLGSVVGTEQFSLTDTTAKPSQELQPGPSPVKSIGNGPDMLALEVSQDSFQGDAQYTVKVDGVQVGGTLTTAALHRNGHSETLQVKGDWGQGSHTVTVTLLNDLWYGAPSTDRNIYVESATYNGVAVAGSNLSSVTPQEQFNFTDSTVKASPVGTSAADTLDGDSGNNTISGLAGNDSLSGGTGNDVVKGGAGRDWLSGASGNDWFVYDTAPGAADVDRIADFNIGEDRILLDNLVFKNAGVEGTLKAAAFWIGAAAHDATDRFIYNAESGAVSYDPDGVGSAAAVTILHLQPSLKLAASQLDIV